MQPQREQDRHVVCGGCETRYAAAQRYCPLCQCDATDREAVGFVGGDPEPVEVVHRE